MIKSQKLELTWIGKGEEPKLETVGGIYLVETKATKDLDLPEVQDKAQSAIQYCKYASDYTTKNNGKPWKYLLIPHDAVVLSMGFEHFFVNFEYII